MKADFSSNVVAKWFLSISVLLLVVSLGLDGFYIDRSENPSAWALGLGLFFIGWISLFAGVVAWLANPCLIISWILSSKGRYLSACLSAMLGLAFSLSFLGLKQIISDEAGNYSRITGYGAGYWVWNASIVVALLGSLASWLITQRANNRIARQVPLE